MFRQLHVALRTGIVTEPAPRDADVERLGGRLARERRRVFGRSLAIRHVDAGSCNACELEIAALTGPHYDLERFGLHIVASPRHADCLLVTGPVTRNMAEALRRTWEATPDPKLVIVVGDCGSDGGIFRCFSDSKLLMNPAIPAPVAACPILVLTQPSAQYSRFSV